MTVTVRKLLQDSDGSYRITLPKEQLDSADLVDEDGETFVKVEGDGREFNLKVLDL